MDGLVLKLPEMTDEIIDSVIEMYPRIKEQFAVYKVTGYLEIFSIILFLAMCFLIYMSWSTKAESIMKEVRETEASIYVSNAKSKVDMLKKEKKKIDKDHIDYLYYLLIPLILTVIAKAIQLLYATDILLLEKLF